MKILVALAFAAILGSLAFALVYMMRGSKPEASPDQPARKGSMATALAFRVGFSILVFLCILKLLSKHAIPYMHGLNMHI